MQELYIQPDERVRAVPPGHGRSGPDSRTDGEGCEYCFTRTADGFARTPDGFNRGPYGFIQALLRFQALKPYFRRLKP